MDMEYMGSLMLSVLIFAPGVMLFVVCGLVGIAVLLEKAGILADAQSSETIAGPTAKPVLPSPGVVDRLSQAIEADAEDEQLGDGTNN